MALKIVDTFNNSASILTIVENTVAFDIFVSWHFLSSRYVSAANPDTFASHSYGFL